MTQEQQTQAQETTVPAQYDLADPSILEELFEVVLYDVVRRIKMVHAAEIKTEDATAMDKQSAAFLAGVLAGKNEQFKPKRFWSGDPLAGYLRVYMKERFEKVGVAEADLADTRGVLQAAAFEFICDVYAMMRVESVMADAESFKRFGQRLCRMWAQRMLGLVESDPIDWEAL